MIWKVFDWQAKQIRHWLTEKRMERLAVIMLDIGLLFLVYTPFSPEPPMIFIMSGLALFFSGVIAVIEANRNKK